MNSTCDRLPDLSLSPALGILAARPCGRCAALWTVELRPGATGQLEARLEDGWLLITERPEAAAPPIAPEALWPVLVQNAAAPPGCKILLTPARSALFRSERWLGSDFDFAQRVAAVIQAFRAAKAGPKAPLPPPAEEATPALENLCTEAGWVATRRSSGRLTVTLPTSATHQAAVAALGQGARVWLPVLDCGSLPAGSRPAAAAIALQTSAALPLVRAAAEAEQSGIRFEAVFGALPEAGELTMALGALSAAAEATGETFLALQDETLARDFLVIRGWSANVNQQKERSAE
jgi:hypothetical protein